MSEYTVTLHRSPSLTDAEIVRRLGQVYDFLFGLVDQKATAPIGDLGGLTMEAAGDSDEINRHCSPIVS